MSDDTLPNEVIRKLLESIDESNENINLNKNQENQTEPEGLSKDRRNTLSESEQFLIDRCATDVSMFMSVMLDKHVRKPFCSFHYQLFDLLVGMVRDHFGETDKTQSST